MRYIRTKDGIYENKPLEKHLGKRRGKGFEIVFKEQDIINQADTIKELCDEFVMISDGKHKLDIGCHSYGDEKIQIYGAIWTNKGLIYVAKMDKKGELELL